MAVPEKIITIRPDRDDAPEGPPAALPVIEGEPLAQPRVYEDREGYLTSRFRLLTKTIHMYLDVEEGRSRLIKRATKGWWIGHPDRDYLRPVAPGRISTFHVEQAEAKRTQVNPNVVSRISVHRW